MKAVLDTNVLVSGMLTPYGTCSRLLDFVAEGILTVCADDRILDEYERVCLDARFRLNADHVRELLKYLRDSAERVVSPPLHVSLPDRSDLPFLEVAAAATAVLVTGNARHFPGDRRAGVRVLSPADFLETLRV